MAITIDEMSIPALRHKLSSATIPQEIYDLIYAFTFTAPSGPIDLTNRRRNPILSLSHKLLHLSPSTRNLVAQSFYIREFCFRASLFMSCINPFLAFLDSIAPQHRGSLRKVTFMRNDWEGLDNDEYLEWVVQTCRERVISAAGVAVADMIVYQLPEFHD